MLLDLSTYAIAVKGLLNSTMAVMWPGAAREADLACGRLKHPRRVYERGAKQPAPPQWALRDVEKGTSDDELEGGNEFIYS